MHVLVTGASGFLGSAVVPELLRTGHSVLGLARSGASAEALTAAGAQVHRGALDDLDGLRAAARSCDGVIHLAFNHDFSQYATAGQTDLAAVEALAAGLAGTDRPLVIASGTALLTAGRVGTERDAADPDVFAATRLPSEQATLAAASAGVRSAIVRLPPSVHDEQKTGFVGALVDTARERGVSAYVGDGSARWAAVHRLDAARLFRLALEQAPAGSVLHGVAEQGVPVRSLADAIGRHLALPVTSVPGEEADEHFGWLATVLASDLPASSALTRELLGWQPTHPGLLADLEQGHYFDQLVSAG